MNFIFHLSVSHPASSSKLALESSCTIFTCKLKDETFHSQSLSIISRGPYPHMERIRVSHVETKFSFSPPCTVPIRENASFPLHMVDIFCSDLFINNQSFRGWFSFFIREYKRLPSSILYIFSSVVLTRSVSINPSRFFTFNPAVD